MEGWIKLHRKIQECWIWNIDKPFDERSAWIDLILSANHKDVKIQFNGELIIVKRGQFLTSVRKLSDRWKWNKDKVLRFLKLLESDKMIVRNSDRFRTLITIENYGLYQHPSDTFQTQMGTQSGTQNVHEPATNKNDKNDKNVKKNINDDLEIFFESIWNLYPVKKGKGSVSKKQKKVLYDIGYEHVKRCIERYVNELESKNKDIQYWKHGSTFFNSGYIDYLDCNYEVSEKKEESKKPEEEVMDLWSDE